MMESCKDQAERDRLHRALYLPPTGHPAPATPPPGFSRDDEMAAFNSLAASL